MFNFFKKKPDQVAKSNQIKTYHLSVKDIVRETPDAVTIVFDNKQAKINYLAGQFLTLIVSVNGKKLRRAYSISTSVFTDEDISVTVKKEPGGQVSTYLNDFLKVGDKLEVMEPMGKFNFKCMPEKQRHIVLIAGGSGITPLFSILRTVLAGELKSTVTLIYSSRNEASIIFKKQLDGLSLNNPRLQISYVLTKPESTWNGEIGRISPANLNNLLKKHNWDAQEDSEFYVCGPDGLMDCVITALKELDVADEKIKKESFVPGNTTEKDILLHESIDNEPKIYSVTVIFAGSEYKLAVPPHKNVLEVGLDMNLDLPYSCRSGLCTSCRGKCISGKVKMDESEGLSAEEINDGYVLTCQSHPLTPDVIIEIG